ncbi:F0F1 ATP synthase subunit alpha [Hydrogenivirga sp.]
MSLRDRLSAFRRALRESVEGYQLRPLVVERGTVSSVGDGIVEISGLPGAQFYEVLKLQSGARCVVIDLFQDRITALLLERKHSIRVGMPVFRTERVASVPVSEELLGRLINPLGDPLDGKPPCRASVEYPLERDAPSVFDRDFVSEQLYTGIKVIDSMFPIGKGQRELILGDPSTGKTSLVVDTILNQKDKDVLCVYVAVGQRKQSILEVYTTLKRFGALTYTVVVAASSEDLPGLQFLAPYAGTAIAEYFLDRGRDVLVVYDDLTKHAFAYQSLSLLLKRPPGREAFPGDIFYVHSRLLERACKIREGGSITALPVVETQAGRIESYIPTNVISITDGQIYLDSALFNVNQRPAVDVGKSVSRIGGKTQIPAFKEVAEHLRLYYAQFLELEIFTRLGVKVFGETERIIRRGRRLRELLKQERFRHYGVEEQVVIFFLLNEGFFDEIDLKEVNERSDRLLRRIREREPEVLEEIRRGKVLTDKLKEKLRKLGGEL